LAFKVDQVHNFHFIELMMEVLPQELINLTKGTYGQKTSSSIMPLINLLQELK
jgi:hypothetical protein